MAPIIQHTLAISFATLLGAFAGFCFCAKAIMHGIRSNKHTRLEMLRTIYHDHPLDYIAVLDEHSVQSPRDHY